jgi:hypothetical protein
LAQHRQKRVSTSLSPPPPPPPLSPHKHIYMHTPNQGLAESFLVSPNPCFGWTRCRMKGAFRMIIYCNCRCCRCCCCCCCCCMGAHDGLAYYGMAFAGKRQGSGYEALPGWLADWWIGGLVDWWTGGLADCPCQLCQSPSHQSASHFPSIRRHLVLVDTQSLKPETRKRHSPRAKGNLHQELHMENTVVTRR